MPEMESREVQVSVSLDLTVEAPVGEALDGAGLRRAVDEAKKRLATNPDGYAWEVCDLETMEIYGV